MTISLIVAASANNAIGKEGKLLWHLPNDMKFFKDITWGTTVIMGRKTFEALGKPLPGRINIVITRQAGFNQDGVQIAENLDDALQQAAITNCNDISVIGGGEIYKQTLEIAGRIYLTRVHATLDGDTFFPLIDTEKWMLKENTDFGHDEKHLYPYSIQVWDKK